MPVLLNVWDKAAGEGGAFVKMFSLNAHAAVKNDPKRYSMKKPSDEPEPSVRQERVRVEAEPTEIPDNWQDLPWQERRKMAIGLGAARNCTSDIANAIISAEAKRRGKEPLPAAPPPGMD